MVGQDKIHRAAMGRNGQGLLGQLFEGARTIGNLFGSNAAGTSSNGRTLVGNELFLFEEKRGVLACVGTSWEKLTVTGDSGASDIVSPPAMRGLAAFVRDPKVGKECQTAKEKIDERRCRTKTTEA